MAAIIRALVMVLSGVGVGFLAEKVAPGKVASPVKQEGGLVRNVLLTVVFTVIGTFVMKYILKATGLSSKIRLVFGAGMMFLGIYAMFHGNSEYGMAILLGTAAGGAGTAFSFNTTYVPEKLIWNDGGNPLTSLRIETQEDGVIHDWSAAAIAAMNGVLNVGQLAANQKSMIVADGHIKNRNVQISGVTSAVGAVRFFGSSDNQGVNLFATKLANIIANNETEFRNFSMLFLPNLVTLNDRVQIFFKDGHSQIFDPIELDVWSSMYQETQVRCVNNLPGYIDKVVVTSAAGGLAYLLAVKI